MSSIVVRREEGRKAPAPIIPGPDFFAPIRDFMEPFRQLALAPFGDFRSLSLFAPFEIKENKEAYLFKADVPGVKEADLEITVTGTRLTVTGKREEEKEEHGDTYYSRERSYGSFTRSFTLPEGSDVAHIAAELKAGVLTISVPKKHETRTKKVDLRKERAAKA